MKRAQQKDYLAMMRHIPFLLFVFYLMVAASSINAQDDAPRREVVHIHTDRPAYIPGENIWFQLYCMNQRDGTFSHRSRLAYIELINPRGLVITRKKILLNQGIGAGQLEIPGDLPSGIYSIFHYTHGMKSKALPGQMSSRLLIYNPEKSDEWAENGPDDTLKGDPWQGDKPGRKAFFEDSICRRAIHIEGLKKSYGHREKIALQLTGSGFSPEHNAHMSLVVSRASGPGKGLHLNSKVAPMTGQSVGGEVNEPDKTASNHTEGPHFCQEQNGILVSGSVTDQQGQPLRGRRVVISFPDTVARLQLTHSDDGGRFRFFIHPDAPARDVVLSVLNHPGKAVFELKDKYLNEYPVDQRHGLPVLKKEIRGYLKDLYLTRRIIKNYNQEITSGYSKADERPHWLDHHFYGQADEVVHFDDYQKLDSINEYFYEVVRSVQTTREGIRLINNNNQFLKGDPAYLIDGVFYEHYHWMKRLLPSQCKSLEVIYTPFLIQDTLFQGVVGLYTQSGDLPFEQMPGQSTRLNYRLYHPSNRFAPDSELQDHLPYYRNTLLWKPGLTVSGDQSIEVEVYAPDNNGWYEVEVFGFTTEGHPLLKRHYFYVGDKDP